MGLYPLWLLTHYTCYLLFNPLGRTTVVVFNVPGLEATDTTALWVCRYCDKPEFLTETDLHFDAGSKVQLHEGINGLFGRFNNIKETFVGTQFVLVACIFVGVR